MPLSELTTELRYYREQRAALLDHAWGKFALIKGEELIGIFDNEDNAYEEGSRLFGTEAFLIQEIRPDDLIEHRRTTWACYIPVFERQSRFQRPRLPL